MSFGRERKPEKGRLVTREKGVKIVCTDRVCFTLLRFTYTRLHNTFIMVERDIDTDILGIIEDLEISPKFV
jgi:hypothetical protein